MSKPNQDLRDYVKSKSVYMWQVAAYYKRSEYWLVLFLRRELTAQQRQEFINAVNVLALNNSK